MKNIKFIYKLLVITLFVITILSIYSCNKKHEDFDYSIVMDDIVIKTYEKDYNFLNNIKYNKNKYILKVDSSKINFNTPGEYELIYNLYNINDNKELKFTKTIKVIIEK